MKYPTIVCLCGSTRFKDEFEQVNKERTLLGEIVLAPGAFQTYSDAKDNYAPGDKVNLDELHKRKIDIADYVIVINVDGYIGESTASEIEYAESKGKRVIYICSERKDK